METKIISKNITLLLWETSSFEDKRSLIEDIIRKYYTLGFNDGASSVRNINKRFSDFRNEKINKSFLKIMNAINLSQSDPDNSQE